MKKVPLETVLADQPRNGWSPPAEYQTGSGVPVLTLSAVTGFNYDGSKVKLTSVPTNVGAHYWLREGELLITRSNTEELVGHVAIYDGTPVRAICCDLIMKMRVDPSKALTRYVYYFLRTPEARRYFSSRAQGASPTMKKIGKQVVQNTPLPLPPLAEQQRIVGVLDEAFEGLATAKANAEKNLQNARALFESHLQSVFTQRGPGWVEKTLSGVASQFGRGKSKHRPRNDPSLYGGPYPFIQTGDVRMANHLITSYSQTYNEAGLAQSKLWPKRTLCITIAANIAETGVLDFEACFPDSIIGFVADESQTSTKFVEYLLQSFKSALQAQGKGSAQANINLGTFETQAFPFPPLSIQQKMVVTLDGLRTETQRLAALYERKVAALEELKKSLLHQAFSGEL